MKLDIALPVTYGRCQNEWAKRRFAFKRLGSNVELRKVGDEFRISHWATTVLTCGADDTLTLRGADISMTTRELLCKLTGLRLFVNSRMGAIDASVFVGAVLPQGHVTLAVRDGLQVRHGNILNPENGTYHIERCDRQVLALFQRTFKDDILKAKALDRLEGTIHANSLHGPTADWDTTTRIRLAGLDAFRNAWMREHNGYKAVLIDPLNERK